VKTLLYILMPAVLFYCYLIVKRKIYIWLPSYCLWRFKKVFQKESNHPIHIIFLIADHFEPGPNTGIVKEWLERYPLIAARHRDADGKPPRHTWFYPCEHAEERKEQLQLLTQLTNMGYGEIELHLHHKDDTEERLRTKLREAIRIYNECGALITVDGKKTFGFVHGNWALDNSFTHKGESLCGVNNELIVLRDEGCYADFTFPAVGTGGQPRKINSIYYAIDNPYKPKSYNTGKDVSANGSHAAGDLMLIQGPITFNYKNWKSLLLLRPQNGAMENRIAPSEEAIDQWIKAGIHVQGRPEWIFVKAHTHGALQDRKELFLGNEIEKVYSYLEAKYNDGQQCSLHYVAAREMYNIVKAAEAGLTGNPGKYRDYLIKPYRNMMSTFSPSRYSASAPE
jgi:hypothetical protein